MFSTETSNEEDAGVFGLISKLCTITASKYCCSNRISQTKLASKMRSLSYEIILRKTNENIPTEGDPIVHLLSVSFISHQNVKNTAEYRRNTELKGLITTLINTDFGDKQENVNNILKFILGLKNSVKDDFGDELFLKPFTFGLLDKMLPRPPPEPFGSPDPYPYYPSHIFNLPFSLKKHDTSYLAQKTSQSFTEYNVETFESKFLTSTEKPIEVKSYLSPMSLQSITSTTTPLIDFSIFNYPKLTGPRDLQIPSEIQSVASNVKVSPPSTYEGEVEEVFRAHSQSFDIWELATQVDKNIPDDIWETVAKLPLMTERQLIASSPREMRLWREMYRQQMNDFKVISERRFIRHIKYLCIGVETNSFPFNKELNSFYMAEDLILEGISRNCLRGYMVDLLITGTYYKRLFNFAFNQNSEDHFEGHGLVYEAAREVIRRYLLEFRLKATAIYEEYCKNSDNGVTCMPTLLQILSHMEPLKREIETIASIFKMIDADECSLPYGADLMSYLFNEISLVTHHSTAAVMFNSLYSICQVYFKFIEKFIFEGELEDAYNEFFIRKDSQYVNLRSKRYWDKGYHIAQSVSVPEFLRSLAKFILLCGKSLRLLKMCNPSDPLVHLISSDHPSVKCCASFEELEHQQELLNVYRTRCMFVTGELVTFDQILLKREAERKAFTEMATLKQAETLEKIVAERKRLAQLIIAEKQHSLRVLEAAMAEAKAAKLQSKMRERKRFELEERGDRATEEVDSLIRDDEKHKIMEYYSKLNMEVEKKQQHTEWKIKRLQLDECRMQLLSTEERNLKREKLELEHKRNEGNPSEMSTRDETRANNESERDGMIPNTDEKVIDDVSDAGKVVRFHGKVRYENKDDIDLSKVDGNTDQNVPNEVKSDPMTESTNSVVMLDVEENRETQVKDNKKHAQSSRDTFINICQVAKNFFGSKKGDKSCDNVKQLDAQGNIINEEENSNTKTEVSSTSKVSSDVIGGHLTSFDSGQFLRLKLEAVQNKMKVMHNEFGGDIDNNKKPNTTSVDNDNNLEWSPFEEARKNKLKVLGDEFGLLPQVKVIREPVTDAHKEALVNKQRVLGVEYNMPIEVFRKEPANIAQEEAIRNKKKMMAADCETITSPKRALLTLNLKSCEVDIFKQYPSNPVTPGELFTALDLETPTTADVPLDGAVTSVFTPRSDYSKDEVLPKSKEYLSAEGFNFPLIPDVAYSEAASDGQTDVSPESSPSKLDMRSSKSKLNYSFFNLLDGTYSLDEFDPFGVRQLGSYSGNYFSSKMDLDMSNASYTHPAVIMDEVKKAPYTNIFTGHYENEDRDAKINCYNIATLTACLQRSVMLPLTYQLEVVNNSILTYFLVNLDMYEHLRSLKDYFFLMDGEFSRSICHNLFTKLTKTLNPQELLNFATLHNILDKALGSSISHVHKFSENLSFTIADTPLSFQHSSPDVLQCLSLTYSVDWPLNIILSQEALLRYAKVFQFLVKMRRIFWVLGEDFENLKLAAKLSKHHSRKLLRSPQYISVQIYRHIMASMIRALDNYIVTTCILSSWTEFETDLKKARTLDDLYECHVVYIKKVLFRCLLNNRSTPVMKLLNDIFTVILKFSRVLKAGEWHQKQPNGKFTHTSFSQLQELYYLFEKLAKYLHKVVTKLMECGYQRHLVELLTMVNLNKYYDVEKPKEKEDQNNSLVGK